MAGIRILIVEDDAIQSKLMKFLLEESGQQVQLAGSADRALEILQSFRPELILVDLELPGPYLPGPDFPGPRLPSRDGLELTRAFRQDPIYATTPIIALTAYAQESDLRKARESGFNGNISKPIDTAAFALQVRNHFGGTAGMRAYVPSDAGDLHAELRNRFLAEGLNECSAVLKDLGALKSTPGGPTENIVRILHRWTVLGWTLGFSEIANQARRTEALVTSLNLNYDDSIQAVEIAQRRFVAATSFEPSLPLPLIKGLLDARIGLVNFSHQDAERIQKTAKSANIQAVIEPISGDLSESFAKYGALVINECGFSSEAARLRQQWPIPAVFIVSRASLESLSEGSPRARDFIVAPWDAEEVLVRAWRMLAKTTPIQPAKESVGQHKRRPRILIADDDPDLIALVSELLGQSGMDCELARGGHQALEIVRRRTPDAIVLDVNMLDLDGFEVLKELRHNLVTQAIPVMMLTGRSQTSDIARCASSGADDYVIKPFEPSDLVARLGKIIAAARKLAVAR